MDNQITDEKPIAYDEHFFQMMGSKENFDIIPCKDIINVDNKSGFTKLNLTSAQKIHIGSLLQQLPSAIVSSEMSQLYRVSFPKGLPHALTALNQGGVGSMLQENGRFVGTASFYSLSAQSMLFGAFTAMSIASSQYFLSQINSELKMMKLNLDKILEFLYGDKKAELMAEVSFVKYAYKNYNTIMSHEQQRIATIVSLQEAKKVAMKDIEFYVMDLDSTVNSKNNSDIISQNEKAFQVKESLDFSMQLYGMSSLLEVYYSQNKDSDYLQCIEEDLLIYIDKCEKRMLSSFSILGKHISDYKGKLWERIDKSTYEKRIQEIVDLLNSGEESVIHKTFRSALVYAKHSPEYYLSNDGTVYLKSA